MGHRNWSCPYRVNQVILNSPIFSPNICSHPLYHLLCNLASLGFCQMYGSHPFCIFLKAKGLAFPVCFNLSILHKFSSSRNLLASHSTPIFSFNFLFLRFYFYLNCFYFNGVFEVIGGEIYIYCTIFFRSPFQVS
jgi:hypothetical protein